MTSSSVNGWPVLEPEIRASLPVELFRVDVPATDSYSTYYDVSPVEDRFVMLEAATETGVSRFNVILNWVEELERLVPTDQ